MPSSRSSCTALPTTISGSQWHEDTYQGGRCRGPPFVGCHVDLPPTGQAPGAKRSVSSIAPRCPPPAARPGSRSPRQRCAAPSSRPRRAAPQSRPRPPASTRHTRRAPATGCAGSARHTHAGTGRSGRADTPRAARGRPRLPCKTGRTRPPAYDVRARPRTPRGSHVRSRQPKESGPERAPSRSRTRRRAARPNRARPPRHAPPLPAPCPARVRAGELLPGAPDGGPLSFPHR